MPALWTDPRVPCLGHRLQHAYPKTAVKMTTAPPNIAASETKVARKVRQKLGLHKGLRLAALFRR